MKLHELINTDKGIFRNIARLNPDFHYLITGSNMDALLLVQYGDRIVFNKFENMDADLLTNIMVKKLADRWSNLIKSVDDLRRYSGKTRTLTETITNSEVRTGSNKNDNLVSAFNDDALINDGGSISNSSDNLEGDKIRTLTDNTMGSWEINNTLSLAMKNNIMDTILHDVADFLTLTIY